MTLVVRRRADLLVVEQGLAPSRTRAQALILAGAVMSATDRKVDKAGDLLDDSVELFLRSEPLPYVSRGGLKLAAALQSFAVDPREHVCLDIGASTGGFTDCLLQHGARKVYGVDVGYGQLAWSLRQDPRVVVIERENIRTLANERIPEPCSLVVIDVSFISLKIVIPAGLRFATADATFVALVKPQFEGIVRDPEARQRALTDIEELCRGLSFADLRSMESPILGAKGNHEFLLHARRRC